jgi:hypothetical protein
MKESVIEHLPDDYGGVFDLIGAAPDSKTGLHEVSAVASGVVAPAWRFGTPAAVHDGTFSYRSALRWTGRMFDLGAFAHGSAAAAAAGRMVEHMRA